MLDYPRYGHLGDDYAAACHWHATYAGKPGTNVMGFWPEDGLWYVGVVRAVNYEKRTCVIKYDDGDEDDSVPWTKTRILDDIPESSEESDE